MKYFFDPLTIDSVEKQFRLLSKYLHPDKPGGSLEEFQEMNKEKEFCVKEINRINTARENLFKRIVYEKKNGAKRPLVKNDIKVLVDFNSVVNLLKEIRKF